MANVIDPCDVNIQMIKADKNNNNNTTTNIDNETNSSSEQCDVLQNEMNNKSKNTAIDSDDHHDLLNNDDNNKILNVVSLSTDEIEELKNIELSPNKPNLYKDFSGIDTEYFITTTLRNNPKDRTLLLTLEKVFQQFIQNEEQTSYQFQAMNSYERMIVHRVAAFFGLNHNVEKNGQSIIVTKTANTRIPNFSFENFIPIDELSNGAIIPSIENTTRRILRRNDKNSNQQIITTTKPSSERINHYTETRDKISNQSSNKINRKQQQQQYFNTNYHIQPTNIQPSSHIINTRTQPIYPSASNSYYPQQQSIDHGFKHQITSSPMCNYVPMMSPTSFQHGTGIQLPILLHQQPTGQIQYVFPTHSLQQPPPLSSDGQYMPVYRSDVMSSIVDNNLYSQPSFVRLYPTHPYPHTQQTTFIQPASSFMVPHNNPTPIQYATNQLATLNLQSHYDNSRFLQTNNTIKPYIQSQTNGLTRMSNYRPIRPLNTHNIDKQITTIENDIKSTINNNSDQISISGPTQEKD